LACDRFHVAMSLPPPLQLLSDHVADAGPVSVAMTTTAIAALASHPNAIVLVPVVIVTSPRNGRS
jgi:hypothetical protein